MSPDSSAVTILSRVPLACVFEICVAALNSPSFASPETEKTDMSLSHPGTESHIVHALLLAPDSRSPPDLFAL
ncbi:hypothetical protein BD626DRAFT_564858 [Schizophyllum amplum]|uniref:Uncharacterized protein n=1 Tax=Schizophyllum amplum TaxID=97359 RepID=A0A550CT71_9AGAR|nr:hypothetical protein BD626DRAFT_564858 [Auriculariopsis ampla]